MLEANLLKQRIERLRECLHKLVIDKQGNFADERVVQLSAELDELIVAYEKAKIALS